MQCLIEREWAHFGHQFAVCTCRWMGGVGCVVVVGCSTRDTIGCCFRARSSLSFFFLNQYVHASLVATQWPRRTRKQAQQESSKLASIRSVPRLRLAVAEHVSDRVRYVTSPRDGKGCFCGAEAKRIFM